MWPAVFAFVRSYAPIIVWPVAAIVGTIGYNIERTVRGNQETPWKPSVSEVREERKLQDAREATDPSDIDSLKKRTFVPKTIFERNK